LVGPGGSGKTRLALETASRGVDRYTHGVWFVPLAPLASTEAIVPTIAQALGFAFYSGEEPKQQLLNYLRGKHLLLLLDNYEHLVEGAGIVAEVLRAAPQVQILVTSRSRLHVQGEHRFPVSGMDYPDLTLALTPAPHMRQHKLGIDVGALASKKLSRWSASASCSGRLRRELRKCLSNGVGFCNNRSMTSVGRIRSQTRA
jgi:predicted ATPase